MIPIDRYAYTPFMYYTSSLLKIGFFVSFALMLLTSESRIYYLYPICIIVAFTEAVVLVLKYARNLLFISLYANYLVISLKTIQKIFATEIEKIEFRHEIFFIILKNGKTHSIKLMNIDNRKAFVEHFKKWLLQNKIYLPSESAEKLNDYAVSG
jgi:hypothetical protein